MTIYSDRRVIIHGCLDDDDDADDDDDDEVDHRITKTLLR